MMPDEGLRISEEEKGLDLHALDMAVYPTESLFQVIELYKDITFHQSAGQYPKIGDVVRKVDHHFQFVFAISNTDSYSAYFRENQLQPL